MKACVLPRLFVLRHAESTFNASGGTTDEVDCDLTPEGVSQARRLGELHDEKGEKYNFDLALVSPLRRAYRTLVESGIRIGTSGQDSAQVKVTHLAREVRLDLCDFLEGEEVWPLLTNVGEDGNQTWRESPQQVDERVEALWRLVMTEADVLMTTAERAADKRRKILIVTHSSLVWYFTNRECDLLNAELAEITHLLETRYARRPDDQTTTEFP